MSEVGNYRKPWQHKGGNHLAYPPEMWAAKDYQGRVFQKGSLDIKILRYGGGGVWCEGSREKRKQKLRRSLKYFFKMKYFSMTGAQSSKKYTRVGKKGSSQEGSSLLLNLGLTLIGVGGHGLISWGHKETSDHSIENGFEKSQLEMKDHLKGDYDYLERGDGGILKQ